MAKIIGENLKTIPWEERPADCAAEATFGGGVAIGATDPGAYTCVNAGDTIDPQGAPRLSYGQETSAGGFACVSTQAGVTCWNAQTGHGFFASRDATKFW